MRALVRLKFQEPHTRGVLLSTGSLTIEEAKERFGDSVWCRNALGCGIPPQGYLGKILEDLRDELSQL